MSELSNLPHVSSGAFKTKSVRHCVELALKAGLDGLELSSGSDWVSDILQPIFGTAGRQINYLVHNYFPPHERPFVLNLAASDTDILVRSLAHCREAIDLSAELHAPFFSVHAGFAFNARPEHLGQDVTQAPRVSLEEAHKTFVRNLRDLCAYAERKGIKLAVENNVIASFNLVYGKNVLGLCVTADDILRTYKDVGAPNLGFLIDVGHLKVTANSLNFDMHAFLDRVAPHVLAFHLSDNDGMEDQNQPFDSRAWFIPRLAEFPSATMVLEAYDLDLEEIRENCHVIVEAQNRVAAT